MTRWALILLCCASLASACSSTTKSVEGDDGCTPAEVRCQGDELQQCDSEGVAFEVKTRCVPGTCVNGEDSCPEASGGTSAGGASGNGGSAGDNTDSGGSSTSGGASGNGGVGADGSGSMTTSTTNGGSGGDADSSGGAGGTTTNGGSGGDVGSSGGMGGSASTGGSGGDAGSGGGTGGSTTTAGGSGGDAGSGSMGTTGPAPFCDPNPCPSDRRCDEDADECVCDGCVIGDACVEEGTENPSNSCQICDPGENTSTYTADVGAACGASDAECSAADTCNGSAVCQPNHVADRTECSDGYCEGGECKVPAFDCIAPDPPTIDSESLELLVNLSDPPTPTGGTVQPGRYTPFRIQYYGDQPTTTSTYSFEFDGIFAQVAFQPHPPWVPAARFAGIFTAVDDTLEFDLQPCDPQFSTEIPTLEYTATTNGMFIFETHSSGTRVVISYMRE